MDQIPDFWRTEVWHPLSVHFPIALLIIASLFKLTSVFIHHSLCKHSASILLYLGTLSAWIAMYTGDLADGIVSRKICDPTILKDHENAAYLMAWIFSAATIADLFSWIYSDRLKLTLYKWAILLLMLFGSYQLIRVGHLGASLVYQQAAGVYTPSENCAEFD